MLSFKGHSQFQVAGKESQPHLTSDSHEAAFELKELGMNASSHTDSLCNTRSNSVNLVQSPPSPRGGDTVQEVRSGTWKMAPAGS